MIQTIQAKNSTWIDIVNPTSRDLKYLQENFHFHPLVLDEIIPPAHRTKIENYGDYLFMIFHVPFLNRKERKVQALEIDILVTKTHIITNRYHSILPLKALFDQCNIYEEAKQEYMESGPGFLLYHILERVIESIAPKMEFLENEIDEVEENIFKGHEKEMVFEISVLKRAVIDFRRIVDPQKVFMLALAREGETFFGKKFRPYFSHLSGSYGQIWDMLETQKETIEALEDTNESLLREKTNEIILVLTVFSVIALPITFVANIFGMNVHFPLSDPETGAANFWIALTFIVVSGVACYIYFKKKRWI